MKIKVAILENDEAYLNRIATVFNTKYSDELEIYSFTNAASAFAALDRYKIDVFLATDRMEIEEDQLPKRCSFAYLVDSQGIESYKNHTAICKFQKVDHIFKQILSIYSDNAANAPGRLIGNGTAKLILFTSPSGGVGTTSMAIACAHSFAQKGKKTLYLNFEPFNSTEVFFQSSGQFGMSDVIYALKSKKTNLSIKIESCLETDGAGVYFIAPVSVGLHMLEFTKEEQCSLLDQLLMTEDFDYIIVDAPFSLEESHLKLYRKFHEIVWVGDGSESSNSKISGAYGSWKILDDNAETPVLNRLNLVYNRFGSKTGKQVDNPDIHNLGGLSRYIYETVPQLIEEMSQSDVFQKLQ